MSISSISAQGVSPWSPTQRPTLNQVLSSFLTQVDGTGSVGDPTTSAAASALDSSTPQQSQTSDADTSGTTGSATTQLSDGIMNLLFQIQSQASATTASSQTASTATDATQSTDPLQQFFSSIDTDGDSEISQTEFENFLTKNGGTKAEADKIFSALDTNGTGELSEAQVASAVQQGQPPQGQVGGGGHHHHGHHGGGASDAVDQLFSKMDANSDGSVSQTELENFVTDNGGTTDDADQDFAALDPNNTGSVTKDAFTEALKNLEGSSQSNQTQSASATNGTDPTNQDASQWLRMIDALAGAARANTTSSVGIAA